MMLQKIIDAMHQKKYLVFNKPNQLNIIGIRSPQTVANEFDDYIGVFYKDNKNLWVQYMYSATTDPGKYWLQNPLQKQGTAILKPGQYKNAYTIGLHRGKYKALVQQLPVTIYRDADKNDIINNNTSRQFTGIFGINIHYANSTGTTTQVNKYSAGCQVFADSLNFSHFMQLAEKHRVLWGNNFTYTLLNQSDIV